MSRKTRRVPKIMSKEDLQKILAVIDKSPRYWKNFSGEYNKWRDTTLLLLMYYAGLRPMEASHLRWEKVDFENDLIHIDPYTNKERNGEPAILTKPARRLLLAFKERLEELRFSCEWVFPSLVTRLPLSTDHLGKRFQALFAAAGIQKVEYYTSHGRPVYNYNMYSMRHTFCTKIHEKTRDPKAVSVMARHIAPESAFRYIHLDNSYKKRISDLVFE